MQVLTYIVLVFRFEKRSRPVSAFAPAVRIVEEVTRKGETLRDVSLGCEAPALRVLGAFHGLTRKLARQLAVFARIQALFNLLLKLGVPHRRLQDSSARHQQIVLLFFA